MSLYQILTFIIGSLKSALPNSTKTHFLQIAFVIFKSEFCGNYFTLFGKMKNFKRAFVITYIVRIQRSKNSHVSWKCIHTDKSVEAFSAVLLHEKIIIITLQGKHSSSESKFESN